MLASKQALGLHVCHVGSGMTNTLHGCLLAIFEFLNRCKDIALSVEDWEMIRKAVKRLTPLEKDHPSFYIKLYVLKLFQMIGEGGDHCFLQMLIADRTLYQKNQIAPGFADWVRLKTELVLQHKSLNYIIPAMKVTLTLRNELDVVESALKVLTQRVVRLSSSSILAISVMPYVCYRIRYAQMNPSLLPVCLDFVLERGATCLLGSDTSIKEFVDFFFDDCIQARKFGTTTVILASSILF